MCEVCLAFFLFVVVSLQLCFLNYKNYPLIISFYFYSTLSFSLEGEWLKSDVKLFGIGISISINTVGRERVSVLLKQIQQCGSKFGSRVEGILLQRRDSGVANKVSKRVEFNCGFIKQMNIDNRTTMPENKRTHSSEFLCLL